MGQEATPEPAKEVSELPQWKAEDWEMLKTGELIPGSTIFGGIALERLLSGDQEPIELEPAVREIPEKKPVGEEWPTKISEKFLSRYFHHAPKAFLVDPQDLLTDQQKQEREKFLNDHANDSGFDLYVYLFDTKQEIPVGESLQGVVLDHFADKESTAVVFYFMGDPQRSELAFSEDLSGEIHLGNMRDLMKLSIEEAMESEESLAQLEFFSGQLARSLSGLEKKLKEDGVLDTRLRGTGEKEEEKLGSLASLWHDFRENSEAFLAVVVLVSLAFSVGLLVFLRYLVNRNRAFVFPDAQGSSLLGAPHAPGVGSVISYHNRTQPPSLQRNNYPDYLQRM
ncbi:MAG: hypothetical protein CBC46_04875 [Verrucomicrobiaceae bacterium TMED86]|nr:MAG: hypothetical protein CBC46_04875 [Verrucomicrobiaceae bacterium TMED86]